MNAEQILVGDSPAMRRLRNTIEHIAPTNVPVLLEGETGTGKELVAGLLHQLSGRRGAFVAFNVCAIADSMFEDALFGHVRGAYTGAVHDASGFLREAHDGTAFFDEIGGLPPTLQAKLLRAIETGVFRPVGSARDTRSDFRFIAATNEGIDDLVSSGRFRADLAHRMSGIALRLPSLAERRGDVPLLIAHLAGNRRVEPAAIALLEHRDWPGNVRELKQVVGAAAIFARNAIDAAAVELALEFRPRPVAPSSRSGQGAASQSSASAERAGLARILDEAAWDVDRAAGRLGMHRSTLYRRMKRLGMTRPRSTGVTSDLDAQPAFTPSRAAVYHM